MTFKYNYIIIYIIYFTKFCCSYIVAFCMLHKTIISAKKLTFYKFNKKEIRM